MICKHGRNEIPEGQTGRYFICKFPGREGTSCHWTRWNYAKKKFVPSDHPIGALCPDMILIDEDAVEEVVVKLEEVIPVVKKPSRKTTVKKPSTRKTKVKKSSENKK